MNSPALLRAQFLADYAADLVALFYLFPSANKPELYRVLNEPDVAFMVNLGSFLNYQELPPEKKNRINEIMKDIDNKEKK
jgi:hypothetical protein